MIDKDLQQHYTSGHLHEAVLAAIIEAGYDPDNLDIDVLAHSEEFHKLGRQTACATIRKSCHRR